MNQLQQVLQQRAEIDAEVVGAVGDGERILQPAAQHGFQQVEHQGAIGQPQHGGHGLGADRGVGISGVHLELSDRLVQQRQAVPHRTVSGARDHLQSFGGNGHPFLGRDMREPRSQLVDRDAAEIKALAAGQHGDRHLAQLGGGKHELYVWRRLLQRLQQGVERRLREHVDFVDDKDLGAGLHRAIASGLDDLAHVVDAVLGCGIHLDHIRMAIGQNRAAIWTDATGVCRGTTGAVGADAIKAAGDDPGSGGFAHAPHAGQHEGMGHAAGAEGVPQGANHRILADQIVEVDRPIGTRQHAVRGRANRNGGGGIVAEQPGSGVSRRLVFEQARHQHTTPKRGGRPNKRPERKLVAAASFRT